MRCLQCGTVGDDSSISSSSLCVSSAADSGASVHLSVLFEVLLAAFPLLLESNKESALNISASVDHLLFGVLLAIVAMLSSSPELLIVHEETFR
jgi:hypothetical protein